MLALLIGCITLGGVQTADTLGKDASEATTQVGIGTFHAPGPGATPGVTQPLLVLESFYRYGVSDRVDLAASAGLTGFGGGARVQLTPPDNGLLYVSVAPHVTIFPYPGPFTHVDLPLLVGVPFGPHQLVAAGRVHVYDYRGEIFGSGTSVTTGGSVGFAVNILDDLYIQPNYTVMFPVSGSVTYTSPTITPGTGVTLSQFSLGLSARFE